MASYPQTNLQLFALLRRSGRAAGDLARLRDAYELAMHLFAGRYRPDGKTFIAHLVGTAGIVAAGLLHAAYTEGDFGASPRSSRQRVRKAAGSEAEGYVAAYAALRWSAEAVASLRAGLDDLDESGRCVLLIRLANELEDCLDL